MDTSKVQRPSGAGALEPRLSLLKGIGHPGGSTRQLVLKPKRDAERRSRTVQDIRHPIPNPHFFVERKTRRLFGIVLGMRWFQMITMFAQESNTPALVGAFNPSEKYESLGINYYSLYMEKQSIHVPNHQP